MKRFLKYGFFVLLAIRASFPLLLYILRTSQAFDSQSIQGILTYGVVPLLEAWVILVLAFGLGANFYPANPASALAVGIGCWGEGLFFLGLGDGFSTKGIIGLSGLVALAACFGLYPTLKKGGWRGFAAEKIPPHLPLPKGGDYLISPIAGGLLLFASWHVLLNALAPVTDYDALMAHLAIPKLYLAAGGIREIPWLLDAHWPHAVQLIYALPLLLHHDSIAAIMHVAAHVALILVMFQAAEQWLDEPSAWIASALLGVQPLVTSFAGTPRVDGWWALFTFLAAVSLWRWKQAPSSYGLLRTGLLTGFGAAAKLLGALPAVIFGAWLLLQNRKRPIRQRLKESLTLLGSTAFVAGPWYVKTWIGAGNPIWPFGSAMFGGKWNAAELAAQLAEHSRMPLHSAYFLLRNSPQALLIPLMILGVLALVPQSPCRRLPPFLRFLWTLTLPYVLVVLWKYEAWRYMLPWLPVLVLTLGWWTASLIQKKTPWHLTLAGLLMAFAVYPVFALTEGNALFAVLHLQSREFPELAPREVYLRRSFPPYAFEQKVNRYIQTHPPAGDLLLFPDTRGYYLDVPYQWGNPIFQARILYAQLQNGHALRDRLLELGIGRLLISADEFNQMDPHTVEIMLNLLHDYAVPVPTLMQFPYALYELKHPLTIH